MTALFSFAPAILFAFSTSEGGASGLILLSLIGVGFIYLPMAILAVGILGTFRGLLPHIVIPSILKAGGLYWGIVGILFMVYLIENYALGFVSDVFIVGALISAFVSMLTLMINGRLLGLLYCNKEEELEWI